MPWWHNGYGLSCMIMNIAFSGVMINVLVTIHPWPRAYIIVSVEPNMPFNSFIALVIIVDIIMDKRIH